MSLENLSPASGASTSNTTTVALGSAATYTGTFEVAPADGVTVSCKADNTGTLYFDFSNDGTNVDTFPVAGFKVASGIHEYHVAKVNTRYFRARLVNDTGAQSYLRLYTYFGPHTHPNSPLNQSYGLDSGSIITRSSFTWLDVVRGKMTGVTYINKFGENDDCAAGDTVDISSTAIDPPATAELCNIVSTAVADDGDPQGVGAWTVKIFGIDENYALAEETVTLNGTTNVSTVNKYWFVYRMYVATGADLNGADGTITCISTDSGAAVLATIAIGANQTQNANYMIPAGHTGYFNLPQVTLQNVTNNSRLDLALYKREFGGVDRLQVQFLLQGGAAADYQQKEFGAPLVFNEKDIIYWKVRAVGSGTSQLTIDYDIWLVNET